ncbi:hypothetical protein [Kineococcus indalonis]|uniref:hypothetical protein n=1 Tax=Kineococcus indalonis TaxID=2696566 RepID=UPI001412484B|nr:hypothetical protein [Kineococcus indalonis]NAZ85949.1 hypothetical protein [Kineococcus indalonis]
MRRAAAHREPWLELRLTVPASSGRLLVRDGASITERPVSCAVVRLDLSGTAPRVLSSWPEDLPTCEERWDLLQVLSLFAGDAAEHWLDPRAALETVLATDPLRTAAAREQWRAALRAVAGPRELVEQVTGSAGAPPEGTSWSAWAHWFEQRLVAGAGAGAVPVAERWRAGRAPGREAPSLHRTGRFDEGLDLTAVVTGALDAGRGELRRAWREGTGAPRRYRLLVDAGHPVGVVVTARPEVSVATRHVALVVERDATGAPVVLDAHPELAPPDGSGEHPVLAAVGTAYLGPALERLEAQPWCAQRALLEREPAGVLDALVDEVEQMLELPDDALRRAVGAAGIAVLPVDLRGWLHRLVWRRRAFPWTTGG